MTKAMLTEAPRRGRTRSLTRERVVQAGLAVMARQGLPEVSLRSVAQHLGVDHKTLYTYVKDKDDLLAGMFDAVFVGLDLPREYDSRSPERQLVDLFLSVRRVLLVNIGLMQLTRPANVMGGDWAAADRTLAVVRRLVPDPETGVELFVNLTQAAVGSALESAGAQHAAADLAARAQQLPDAARGTYVEVAHGWAGLDREAAFKRLAHVVVRAALASSRPTAATPPARVRG